jgi:hypothetical protein
LALSLAREVGLGLWNHFLIPAGRVLHWAAFPHLDWSESPLATGPKRPKLWVDPFWDIRFRVLAEDWQRTGRRFAGLVFGHQRRVSFGELIVDLELIAKATDAAYWENRIEQLPL